MTGYFYPPKDVFPAPSEFSQYALGVPLNYQGMYGAVRRFPPAVALRGLRGHTPPPEKRVITGERFARTFGDDFVMLGLGLAIPALVALWMKR